MGNYPIRWKRGLWLGVLVATIIFSLLFVWNRQKEVKLYKMTGSAQGTYYSITYCSRNNENFQPVIDSLFRKFDRSVSAYVPNSLLSRMNNNDSMATADEIYETIFHKAMEVSACTGGAFDVTVGPLVNAWGFGFSKRANMDQQAVDSLLPLVGYQKVKLVHGKLIKSNPAIRIDFDAIAQGYSSDWLARFLENKGINDYLIDVGGEVLGKGVKPDGSLWKVAIEKPAKNSEDERKIQAVISLNNKAISTSGSYRKYYEENGTRYSHTIDPTTGYPVRHNLLSVSVLANDCITADAFATSFMVMGLEKSRKFLANRDDIQAYFISDDGNGSFSVFYTPAFDQILKSD